MQSPRVQSISAKSAVTGGKGPLRVLQVVDTLGMGGAETWLMGLLRHWSRTRSVQMDFLLTSGMTGLFDNEAAKLGARLHYIRYGLSVLPEFATKFRWVLREFRYDAIHDHQDFATGWHFLLGLGALPSVRATHIHNPRFGIDVNYSVNLRRRVTAGLGQRLVRRMATHVIGTSDHALVAHGFDPSLIGGPKIGRVHCGISVDAFSRAAAQDRLDVRREFGWEPAAKVVLFAGRLDRELAFFHPTNHKNSWFALNVIRAAIEKYPGLRFIMAGAGDAPRRELESHVTEWGLNDKIRLTGVRMDMPRLLGAADLLLFPSRAEGLGMVAVEAQAAGVPVLASDAVPRECVVIPELYTALSLDEPIEHWAAALMAILARKSPVTREQSAQAVRRSPFSIEVSAARLERIYSGQ